MSKNNNFLLGLIEKIQAYSFIDMYCNSYSLYLQFMAELYRLSRMKRPSIRVNKALHKLSEIIQPIVWNTSRKQATSTQKMEKKSLPTKEKAKDKSSTVNPSFHLCSSKNVFVFSRKQIPISTTNFQRSKQVYRREMTEQVFCSNNSNSKHFYRNRVRSNVCQKEKLGVQPQRRVSTSQTNRKNVYLKPQPWQMKREGEEFQSLF